MSIAPRFLTLSEVISQTQDSVFVLFGTRFLMPVLFSLMALGWGGLFLRKNSADFITKALLGTLLGVVGIHVHQVFDVPVSSSAVVIWALGGLALAIQAAVQRKLIDPLPRLFLGCWLAMVLFQGFHRFPVEGDPLAFLVHAKQWLLSDFRFESIDPSQRAYPDFWIVCVSLVSSIFRIDPLWVIQGLTPLLNAALLFVLLTELSRSIQTRLSGRVVLIGLFSILAVQDPFRTSVLFARNPFALSTVACVLLLGLGASPRIDSMRIRGGLIAVCFLSHPGWIPLLFYWAGWEIIAARNLKARFKLVGAGGLALLLSLPRLKLLLSAMRDLKMGPEVSSAPLRLNSEFFQTVYEGWLQASFFQVTKSPVTWLFSVVALLGVGLAVFRSRKKIDHSRLMFWLLAWPVVGLSCIGLFESLGIPGISSHYSKRQLGLVLIFLLFMGLAFWMKKSEGKGRMNRLTAGALALMGIHLIVVVVTKSRENTFGPDSTARDPAGYELLAQLESLDRENPTRVKGLLTEARGERGFMRTVGAGHFFPYFFPEDRALLSFVPSQGMRRDDPAQMALWLQWMETPTRPESTKALQEIGINWILGRKHGDWERVYLAVRSRPDLYRLQDEREDRFLAEVL